MTVCTTCEAGEYAVSALDIGNELLHVITIVLIAK